MAYLLDANIFISAWNLHYDPVFCPAFWDWLIEKNLSQRVFSIEKVEDELRAGYDKLAAWAADRGSHFFIKPDAIIPKALQQVSSWIKEQNYAPAAESTFFQVADFYLVAQALAYGHTIVTHEIADNSIRRIKIPNVCIGLSIKCMTPYEMLKQERARFVLQR